MHLLPLIFGIVFLPKACTLKCHICLAAASETCEDKEEITCPPLYDQCATIRFMTYLGTTKVLDSQTKGCVPEELCGDASLNSGLSRHVISTKCCLTDLCNKNETSEPSIPSSNGKTCYYCDGTDCTNTVNCVGNEDYCITAKVKKFKMKGCASKQICYGALSEQLQGFLKAKFCCQGDLCNSASSTHAGLLLLVALFVSLVTFS
ncbi:uncharacterized protein LOC109142393 [Larimichthys crocea]|uniref:uncharacterized protein LOC109142393 n=1 Tax=Larimichthys crocea TaxID=215358 RepID=UPI000F5F9CDD|nr:uncharacterized protein LOC109142393 [Larimichthys crocea]